MYTIKKLELFNKWFEGEEDTETTIRTNILRGLGVNEGKRNGMLVKVGKREYSSLPFIKYFRG